MFRKAETFRWSSGGGLTTKRLLFRILSRGMPPAQEHTHHIRIRNTQLEMDAAPRGNGDDVDGKLRMAQSQLEQLQAEREELERLKLETERLNARKRDFIASQVEMTERLASSVTLIDRELFELRQEIEDLEQCRSCFSGHLSKIEKLNPDGWTREQLPAQLDRSLAIVEHAEDEYGQAAEHFAKTRSASIFSGVRSAKRRSGEFSQQFVRGLAFNLPVIVLGSVALVAYLLK
jgi:chromosome segregation ATPase